MGLPGAFLKVYFNLNIFSSKPTFSAKFSLRTAQHTHTYTLLVVWGFGVLGSSTRVRFWPSQESHPKISISSPIHPPSIYPSGIYPSPINTSPTHPPSIHSSNHLSSIYYMSMSHQPFILPSIHHHTCIHPPTVRLSIILPFIPSIHAPIHPHIQFSIYPSSIFHPYRNICCCSAVPGIALGSGLPRWERRKETDAKTKVIQKVTGESISPWYQPLTLCGWFLHGNNTHVLKRIKMAAVHAYSVPYTYMAFSCMASLVS